MIVLLLKAMIVALVCEASSVVFNGIEEGVERKWGKPKEEPPKLPPPAKPEEDWGQWLY